MRSKQSAIVFASALLFGWPALAVDNVTQPLNRADCDKAGMHWDDSANVCAANQAGSPEAVLPKAESSATSKPESAMTKPSKKTTTSSKQKKQVSTKKPSRKHVGYKKQNEPAATKPIKQRPLHWLFPNANKKARASQ